MKIIYSRARSSIDRRIVAGLAGAAAAAFIGFALHAAFTLRDSDGDGLTDKEEEEIGTDPGKPNLNVYAKEQGISDGELLKTLQRIDDTDDGRAAVDAIAETLKAYPGLKDEILARLKEYGHSISQEEAKKLGDLDGDGIPNWDEKIIGGDPLRRDGVLAYGLGKLNPEEAAWEIVRRINEKTGGELSEDAKKAVDAVASNPVSVRNDEHYVDAVNKALNNSLKDAASIAMDADKDGLPNSLELQLFGRDAVFAPNPVLGYAYQRGLDLRSGVLVKIVKPLENDGRLDDNDAKLVDALAANAGSVERLEKFLTYVTKDGVVDEEEAAAVPIILKHPVIITGLSGKYAVGEQTYNFGHTLSKPGIKVSFGDEAYRVAIVFVSDNPDFAEGHPYASYGLIKDAMILIGHMRYGIAAIMNPLKDISYGKVYEWDGEKFSVRSIVNKQVENISSVPEVAERLTADYVLANAGDAETADVRIMTATLPTYALHWCDFEKRMYFFEVLPRDVAWDGLPRLWLAWRNVSYWPELHRIAERVLAGKEIDPDTGKPYTSVESLKLRFDDFGPKTRADMLKLATQGSEMAKAAFPLYHYAVYNHESIDEFRVELYRALMWAEGLPSYRAGNIDATNALHGEPGIPLAPSDIKIFKHLVVEPLTKVSPYHPFREDEPWVYRPGFPGNETTKSVIQYPWYEVVVFKKYEVSG